MKPFLDSNAAMNDADHLRRTAERDGYLFFRGLLDRESVFEVRRDFVGVLKKHNWVEEGAYPNDTVTRLGDCRVEGMDEFWPIFDDFQSLESFHALAHHPNIISVLDRLFGELTLVHPRNIGRIIFPTTPATPPHQDYIHIQGTPNTWTAWIPLGDVPFELGPVAVLARSHRFGVLGIRHMMGAGGAGVDKEPPNCEWVGRQFEAGDVLFFHSWTVHKGLPNQTGHRIRLSVDYRYQGVSQPVVEASLQPHFNRWPWEFAYRGWKSSRCRYYWKDKPLNIAARDPNAYRWVGEKEIEPTGEKGY